MKRRKKREKHDTNLPNDSPESTAKESVSKIDANVKAEKVNALDDPIWAVGLSQRRQFSCLNGLDF